MDLFYDFLFISGIILSSLYITILLNATDKSLSHKILALFFGTLIIVILDSYAFIHKIEILSIITFIPASSSKFFLGALLFVYIKSLFYEDTIIIKKYWKTFIPFFLFLLLYSFPFFIASISNQKFFHFLNGINNYRQMVRIVSDVILFLYIFLCFNSFFRLKKVMKCTFSNIEHNNFIWIKYILIASITIISVDFIFVISQVFFNVYTNVRTQNFIMFLLVISIIYAAYFGLKQSKVLVPYFLLENNEIIKDKDKFTASNSIIEFEKLEIKLKNIFIEEKPYLDTELNLRKLAEITAISDKKLSTLLNQHLNISFYDFVNDYRINTFKDLIKSDAYNKYTIETIANQSGFKSKASFYRIFKLKMNMSPSEFRNSL